jgi:hypothetical protein
MDNKKIWMILGAIGAVALVVLISTFVGKSDKGKKVTKKTSEEFPVFGSEKGYADSQYPDAPLPYVEDPSMEDEAVNLWPTAIKSVKDDKHREKVKEEWRDFATKYPKNIYVMNEFRPAMTEKEAKERRATMETFTGVDATYARMESKFKYSEPGSEPPKAPKSAKDAGVTPDEQKVYFSYRIRELESRIELMDYVKENKGLTEDQVRTAEKRQTGASAATMVLIRAG